MSAKTKHCPYPGCTTMISRRNQACRQHTDFRAVSHPPVTYNVIRNCQECGNPFAIKHSRQFICDPCRTKVCPVCDKTFFANPRDGRITCSPECSTKHNAAPMLICQRCGQPFKQRQGRAMKYCTPQCRYLASRIDESMLSAERRRSWRYKHWRNAVLARDDYTCQQCGATDHLHAHHVKPWEAYPDLAYEVSNGKTICSDCHAIIHGAAVPLRGAKRHTCAICAKPIKGRSRSGLCRSCGMRHSAKFWASQAKRQHDASGHFSPRPVGE